MWASALVYLGLVLAAGAGLLTIRPLPRLGFVTRRAGLGLAAAGVVVTIVGFTLPARESRAPSPAASKLDEVMPAWQFHERHSRWIAAPPERVYDALRRVRADDIALFNTLTWIRRGGRPSPPGILNAGGDVPLLDLALASGFVSLADDPPRELVFGTVLAAPPGTARSPAAFARPILPGIAVGVVSFQIRPQGGGSIVSTETRVFASGAGPRRSFSAYWRLIYPGSALIRRMWLRAIENEALGGSP